MSEMQRAHTRGATAAPVLRSALAALALACAATTAAAQMHEASSGGYRLRANAVRADLLPKETAQRHGIAHDQNNALINVVVLRDGGRPGETVPARVSVTARNLTGQPRQIPMREAKTEGYVSYFGTFPVAPREVTDFTVEAQPRGGQTLRLAFRQQFFPSER